MQLLINKQSGSSLIEFLVALLVTSVGVVGHMKNSTKSMNHTISGYAVTLANYQASQIAERMRSNTESSDKYLDAGEDKGCYESACSTDDMALYDVFLWNAELATQLPAGQGEITKPVAQPGPGVRYIVTVRWDGGHNGATGKGCDPLVATDLYCVRLEIEI